MTANKWIFLTIFIVLCICLVIIKTYQNIYAERWSEEHYVKSSLREYFVYDTINFTEKYVWDEMYWLVKGQSNDGMEKMVVWQDLNIVHSSPVSELMTEEQLLGRLKEGNSDLVIERIEPAFFRENLSYEVQTRAESGHLVMTFYTMTEGQLIDQFILPK